MVKIVCNFSPIIGLCIIKKLNLLWKLFNEVYITEEVYREIVQNNELRHYGEQELINAVEENKIVAYKVKNSELVEAMIGRLHRGELEVIQAARELSISRVIIDEVKSYLDTLIQEDYRISKRLYIEALKIADVHDSNLILRK